MSAIGVRIGEALAIRPDQDLEMSTTPLTVHICGTIVEYPGHGPFRQPFPKTSTSDRFTQVPEWLDEQLRARLADPANLDKELLVGTRNDRPASTGGKQSGHTAGRGLPPL